MIHDYGPQFIGLNDVYCHIRSPRIAEAAKWPTKSGSKRLQTEEK